MASGYLNLAYMAELAVVVSLAYLELKSLRYIQEARVAIEKDVAPALESIRCNGSGNGGVSELFMDLHHQAKNLFDNDGEARRSAWYTIEADNQKCRYTYSATWFYPFFIGDRDKRIATYLLVGSCVIIVLMTILTKLMPVEFSSGQPGEYIWWAFFGFLFLSITLPTAFILVGRRIKNVSAKISRNIKERKDKLATDSMRAALGGVKAP